MLTCPFYIYAWKKEVSSIKTKSVLCVWNRMKATMMMTMKGAPDEQRETSKKEVGCLPLSLSMPSLQFISNGVEQSDPAHPSIQSHRYSPSSSVHWPWREQPFSQPAVNWEKKKNICDKKGLKDIKKLFFMVGTYAMYSIFHSIPVSRHKCHFYIVHEQSILDRMWVVHRALLSIRDCNGNVTIHRFH